MYRARVTATSGKMVKVNGIWATCIGNKPVRTGDLVWTDGRCVYGNFIECGQPNIILPETILQGIPILTKRIRKTKNNRTLYYRQKNYYHFDIKKRLLKKLKVQQNASNISGLVNNKHRIRLIKNDDYITDKSPGDILDAEISDSGDVFVLKNCFIKPTDATGIDYPNVEIKDGNIFKNDQIIGNYVEEILSFMPVASASVTNRRFRIINGFIDSEGHYHIYAGIFCYSGTYYDDSAGIMDNDTDICKYVIISDKGSQVIFESAVDRKLNDEMESGLYNVNFQSEFKFKSNSLKIPMADNWYFTFEIPSFLINPPDSVVEYIKNSNKWNDRANTLKDVFSSYGFVDIDIEYYKIKIFNPNDEHILTIETVTLFWKINVCSLNNNEYIVQIPASIYNDEYIFIAKKSAVVQLHYVIKTINESHINEDDFLSFKDEDTGENMIVDTTGNFRICQLEDLDLYKKAVRKSLAN